MNADTRSIPTMSTILDDGNQPDEADDTSSLRSMSSTTSTNYAPKARQNVRSLYTIPDEAATSEGDEDEDGTGSQSETQAAQDLPASAAAQTLHQEADELMPSSQHASSSADSLPDMPLDPVSDVLQNAQRAHKGLSSDGGSSADSRLSPVSEAESSGQALSTSDYEGKELPVEQLALPLSSDQAPGLSVHQQPISADTAGHKPKSPEALTPLAEQAGLSTPLQSKLSDAESLHTPRAMSPPHTPGAPLVPKIDAGPAVDAPAQLQAVTSAAPEEAPTEGSTMFAGLDMM